MKDLDRVCARPGATLAAYRKLMHDAADVSIRQSWDPRRPGTAFKLYTEERENIRQGVAKVVRQAFATEWQAQDRHPVVEHSGADVLRVKADTIASRWARILRIALDKAQTIGTN